MDWSGLHWYNARMQKIKGAAFCWVIMTMIFLSACAQGPVIETVTPTMALDGTLRPYPSDTPTATPFPTGYSSPTPSPTSTPTATLVFYEVRVGDDMTNIAWRYNLSPAAIMTANPSVNPRVMSVGTMLLIPVTPMPEATPTEVVELFPTPTPQYKALREPDCYADALGGLWCFVLVENDEDQALENISAEVVLNEGDLIRQEIAIMPLNLLPAGKSLPLIAYFQPQVSANFTVSAQIEFLLPVMPDDQRYLTVEILDPSITMSQDDKIARVRGKLYLLAEQESTRYIWLSATAFDQAGHIVAVRRWDSQKQLSAGESTPFELYLYSMGGAIDRIDLLAEAQSVDGIANDN